MALQPPETPEGPGWCGQGAARDQHGPAPSGVASQRPNRLRGLSVEGRCPSRDLRKRQGRTDQTINRLCQALRRRTRKEGCAKSTTSHLVAATVPSTKVSAARESPCGQTEYDATLRTSRACVAACDLRGMIVKVRAGQCAKIRRRCRVATRNEIHRRTVDARNQHEARRCVLVDHKVPRRTRAARKFNQVVDGSLHRTSEVLNQSTTYCTR